MSCLTSGCFSRSQIGSQSSYRRLRRRDSGKDQCWGKNAALNEITLHQLASHLHLNRGTTLEAAYWAVEAWAWIIKGRPISGDLKLEGMAPVGSVKEPGLSNDAFLQKTNRLLEENKFEEVLEILDEALASDPNNITLINKKELPCCRTAQSFLQLNAVWFPLV